MLQDAPNILPIDPNLSPKEDIELLKSMSFNDLMHDLIGRMVTFAINLAVAIVVFYVGKFLISKLCSLLSTVLIKRKADKSLSSFILSFVRMILYFLLIVTVIGILGIETSSFIALFASAGVAIGMALSGTLQNFAGGVLILLIKPYKVGDYIEAQGYAGTVKEIQIFNTIITTPDYKQIIIPNGGLSTASVNNYSREDYRRVDWSIAISYGDDVDAARNAILDMLNADSRIVKKYIEDDRSERAAEEAREHEDDIPEEEPKQNWFMRLFSKPKAKVRNAMDNIHANKAEQKARALLPKVDRQPVVWLSELADSSVNLTVRAWTRNEDYWGVYFDFNERFYKNLPIKGGVHFPFPQLDVHVCPSDSQPS